MGIDVVTAEFLAYCTTLDVDFSKTLTLGRQSLYVNRRDTAAIFRKFSIPSDAALLDTIFSQAAARPGEIGFADGWLRALGAATVDSIDASDYEGASVVHDMNRPISSTHAGSFSVVVDGGTLEHVFNFGTAIDNCMRLLRPAGHFISICPANNFFGHGFYQFSSELFYRTFSEANGFRVRRVFLAPEKPFGAWYQVPDPASVRQRVSLINQVATLQLFVAQKISDNAGLHEIPAQSDYHEILWKGSSDAAWTAHGDSRMLRRARVAHRLGDLLPRAASNFLKGIKPRVVGAIRPPFHHPHLRKFRP